MFWTLLLGPAPYRSSTYRDSLAHKERDVLAYGANISKYFYCGIHKCFHPRINREQYGGEI